MDVPSTCVHLSACAQHVHDHIERFDQTCGEITKRDQRADTVFTRGTIFVSAMCKTRVMWMRIGTGCVRVFGSAGGNDSGGVIQVQIVSF